MAGRPPSLYAYADCAVCGAAQLIFSPGTGQLGCVLHARNTGHKPLPAARQRPRQYGRVSACGACAHPRQLCHIDDQAVFNYVHMCGDAARLPMCEDLPALSPPSSNIPGNAGCAGHYESSLRARYALRAGGGTGPFQKRNCSWLIPHAISERTAPILLATAPPEACSSDTGCSHRRSSARARPRPRSCRARCFWCTSTSWRQGPTKSGRWARRATSRLPATMRMGRRARCGDMGGRSLCHWRSLCVGKGWLNGEHFVKRVPL